MWCDSVGMKRLSQLNPHGSCSLHWELALGSRFLHSLQLVPCLGMLERVRLAWLTWVLRCVLTGSPLPFHGRKTRACWIIITYILPSNLWKLPPSILVWLLISDMFCSDSRPDWPAADYSGQPLVAGGLERKLWWFEGLLAHLGRTTKSGPALFFLPAAQLSVNATHQPSPFRKGVRVTHL